MTDLPVIDAYFAAIRAKDAAGNIGTATSYGWTIDLTAPTVTAINRADPSPTNAVTVHWAVSFSKSSR